MVDMDAGRNPADRLQEGRLLTRNLDGKEFRIASVGGSYTAYVGGGGHSSGYSYKLESDDGEKVDVDSAGVRESFAVIAD